LDQNAFGNIYTGQLGIALAYLRLKSRHPEITEDKRLRVKFDAAIQRRINPYEMELSIQPGRPSPMSSPSLGAAVVRLLARCPFPSDYESLLAATKIAIGCDRVVDFRGHDMGVDEVLYGRAGLLLHIIDIYECSKDDVQATTANVYQAVPELVHVIIKAGEAGAEEYRKSNENDQLPLMWTWFDEFHSLGSMHGITGILSVLLHPLLPELLQRHGTANETAQIPIFYEPIAGTISGLCRVAIDNNGHLPMSIPPRTSTRQSPLIQLCHGIPGLLLLLAAARHNKAFRQLHWDKSWDEAITLGCVKVWEEGLLSKGGGLCHGIAGNAIPLLLLQKGVSTSKETDEILRRGLAMLLLARETPPYAESNAEGRIFRTPDNPYSLFEGLAGMMSAWAEACLVIKTRIAELELEGEEKGTST
jgi:hypothetical protein